jgi:lipopolysaccharide/colanic/teichoic acid biosynthesis glycosyltransferase
MRTGGGIDFLARQFATPLEAQAVATSRRRDGASAPADGRARLGFVADDRAGNNAYFVCKRVLDVVVAILLGILVVPLIPVVVLAIKIDSPGPALFRQERVRGRRVRAGGTTGWEVVPFSLLKFRTMHIGADTDAHRAYMTAYIVGDEDYLSTLRADRKPGDSYRPAADPRITRVGAVLRKLSIDEIPQLWNVLRGEMSIVGPRPPVPYEVELYDEWALGRMAAPGGITGLAQVRGRCTVGFEEMVQLDLDYIARRSIWRDLQILFLTVPVVLSRKGAG